MILRVVSFYFYLITAVPADADMLDSQCFSNDDDRVMINGSKYGRWVDIVVDHGSLNEMDLISGRFMLQEPMLQLWIEFRNMMLCTPSIIQAYPFFYFGISHLLSSYHIT